MACAVLPKYCIQWPRRGAWTSRSERGDPSSDVLNRMVKCEAEGDEAKSTEVG